MLIRLLKFFVSHLLTGINFTINKEKLSICIRTKFSVLTLKKCKTVSDENKYIDQRINIPLYSGAVQT